MRQHSNRENREIPLASDSAESERSANRLDVGDVLQAGAGGVGLCLAYWLRDFGVIGNWRIADRDNAVVSNTNRCLGLLAADTGWLGGAPRNKAVVAAELFGAIPHACWYDELDLDSFQPDLVLPLANERNVRQAIAARGEPVILHATTSRAWEAQLHRHLPGSDDCITCRLPGTTPAVQFGCSTVPVAIPGAAKSADAALPFLSATAALMLVTALYRL